MPLLLAQIFERLDANGDGVIDRHELAHALSSSPSQSRVEQPSYIPSRADSADKLIGRASVEDRSRAKAMVPPEVAPAAANPGRSGSIDTEYRKVSMSMSMRIASCMT